MQEILNNQNNPERAYYKDTVIKTVQYYWHKGRQWIDQQNKTEKQEKNSYACVQFIFDKDSKTIQWEKIVFLTNGAGTTFKTLHVAHAKD